MSECAVHMWHRDSDWVVRAEWLLPLYACGVSAGFPSPADDYLEGVLDLNTQYKNK